MKSDGFNLGRVLGRLEYLLEDERFDRCNGRPKDFMMWWDGLTDDGKEDYLRNNAYHLQNIVDTLSECVIICRGHDELNSPNN